MRQGIQKMGAFAKPLLSAMSVLLMVGSAGLISPAFLDLSAWLVPAVATGLGVMMLASIPLHLKCRDNARVFVSGILFILCAFVAHGRWVMAPI